MTTLVRIVVCRDGSESEVSRDVRVVAIVLWESRESLVSEANRNSEDCWSPEVMDSEVSRDPEDCWSPEVWESEASRESEDQMLDVEEL